jgi:DNA polymerase I-like protein with 3'-5' exonuclease and polymerase domains
MIHYISKQTSNTFIKEYTSANIATTSILKVIEYCKKQSILSIDTETEGLFNHKNKIIMFQIGDDKHQFVIDTRGISLEPFKIILENPNIIKVLQNASFDYKFLRKEGIMLNNIWDTQIAEMILTTGLNKRNVSLQALCLKYLNTELDKTVRNQFVNLNGLPFTEKQITYGAKDVKYLLQIRKQQLIELENYDLLNCMKLENKFVDVLADIEYNGFYVDTNMWLKLGEQNNSKLIAAKKDLDNYIIDNNYTSFIDYQLDMFSENKKCLISWDSPMQVVKFLKVLGVETAIKDRKTGKIKDTCEEKNIGKYKKKFPFLKLYFKYKAIAKEVSTYGVNFLSNVNKTTGRIHSNYWQIISTGRISSHNPNLQNIPAKVEKDGTQPFRECFRGYKDNILLVADYSQQEPRVTADKCKDPALIDFYLTGDGDTHSMVSSKMFSVIEGKEVIIKKGDPRRQIGKVLNLKLDYGGSAYTVKDDLNTTEEEAQVFINALIKAFPEKRKYFDNTFKKSLQQGYILIDEVTKRKSFSEDFETLKNYTDALDKLNNNKADKAGFNWSEFYKLKGKIQRNSQNYPIQGTSGSMTKLAAIYLKRELLKKELYGKVWIVNLVHDEIVVETSNDYSEEVSKLITLCMEEAGKVFCKTIPMIAETVKSKYWTH